MSIAYLGIKWIEFALEFFVARIHIVFLFGFAPFLHDFISYAHIFDCFQALCLFFQLLFAVNHETGHVLPSEIVRNTSIKLRG